MASLKPWLDVCLKNVVIFLAACAGMGVDPEVVWRAVERALGRSVERAKATLKEWVTLGEYQVVEDAVVEEMGHAAYLVEVGRYSVETAYGGSRAINSFFRRLERWGGFMMRLISPRVAIHRVDRERETFVRNKRFHLVEDAPDHAILEVEYTGNGGGARTATEDQRSLLGHIRGVLESIAMHWPRSQRRPVAVPTPDGRVVTRWVGRVDYMTVDIHPAGVLAREFPPAECQILPDGNMVIRGAPFDARPYGRIVHLRRDRLCGAHTGRELQQETDEHTLAAILITRDVCTPCKKTGRLLPVMRAGEIFRYKAPLRNLVLLQWRSTFVNRLIEWIFLPRISQRLLDDLEPEVEVAELLARDAAQRREQAELRAHMAEHYPNERVGREVVEGMFQPEDLPTVVFQADLVGFTSATTRMASGLGATWIDAVINEARRVINQHGGWLYKTAGDCIVAVFAPGFHHRDESWTPAECVLHALLSAGKLMGIAKDHGWGMRIGLHAGFAFWRRQAAKLEGFGDPFNLAQRLEHEYGQPGCVKLTYEALRLLYPHLDLRGLRVGEVVEKDWTYEGTVVPKGYAAGEAGGKDIAISVFSRQVVEPPTAEEVRNGRTKTFREFPAVPAVGLRLIRRGGEEEE